MEKTIARLENRTFINVALNNAKTLAENIKKDTEGVTEKIPSVRQVSDNEIAGRNYS